MILIHYFHGRHIQLKRGLQAAIKRLADLEGPDFFSTPAWATYALIDNKKLEGDIWESGCGNGAMSNVLAHTGQRIISTDLFDRGFGEIGEDFLAARRRAANIVTNPPYNSAEGFVRSGLSQSTK
jgi:hypothetical protein